jgi:catalase (peroxidase I)
MKNKLNQHKIKPLITSMLCLFLLNTVGMAQVKTGKGKAINIPFEAGRWDTTKQHAEFLTYKNVKAMKIVRGKGGSNQVKVQQ